MKYVLLATAVLLFSEAGMANGKRRNISQYRRQQQDSLSREINAICRQGYFNGFAVSIVSDTGAVFQQGFGYADVSGGKPYTAQTIQYCASVSKTLVGIALLKAQELGKLRLDESVDQYLPFHVANPRFPQVPITIRHLATHTSSIADNDYYLSKNYRLVAGQDLKSARQTFDDVQVFNPADSAVSLRTFLENMLGERGTWRDAASFTEYPPGTVYEYSNVGTALAAYIIEQATGTPFESFTETHILTPLRMTASGWHFTDVKRSAFSRLYENPATVLPWYETASYPDGGFITSVADLSKFLAELIRGYEGKGSILSAGSYCEYFRPQLSDSNFTDRNVRNPYSESYNVGIFIGFGYTGYIGHTGGDPGVLSMMFFDPKTRIGRIMLFNTSFAGKAGNDAFYGVWNVLEKYGVRLRK